MNTTAAAISRSRSGPWTAVLLSGLALLVGWFVVRSAIPYLAVSPNHYGPYFWPRRWWLVLHIAGGIVALGIGLVQLWLGLTARTSRMHRALGRIYVGAILLGSIAGFYLAVTISGNATYGVGLFMLCVAWVITTSMALFAIRRRNVSQHREWMLRSYTVTFAFVTFRFGVDTLAAQGMAIPEAQGIMAWACWSAPLLLLEPVIQLRR